MIFLNLALVAALAIEGAAAANTATLTVPKVIVGRSMPMDWGFVERSPLARVMGPVSKRVSLACPTGYIACNSSGCAPYGSVCCDGGQGFCSEGTYCYTNSGVNGCCPTGQVCGVPSGCQAGSTACPNNPTMCVIEGGACCTGATSCPAGFSCCSDGCCADTSTDSNATTTADIGTTTADIGTSTRTTTTTDGGGPTVTSAAASGTTIAAGFNPVASSTGTAAAASSSIPPITMGSNSVIAADLNSYVDWQGNWQTTTGSCASDARIATSNVSMSMKCSSDVAGYVMSMSVPKSATVMFNIDGEDYTYGWSNLKTPLGTYQNCNITYAYAFENTQDHVCSVDIGMAASTDQSSQMQVNAVVAFKNVADMQNYLNAAQSVESSSASTSATSTSAAKPSATSKASGAVPRAGINFPSAVVVACAVVLFVSAF